MTQLWQSQPIDRSVITLDGLHRQADRLQRAVRRRNTVGLLVAGAEIVAFGGMWLAYPDPESRIGCAMTLGGLLFMAWQLTRRPAVGPADDLGLSACLDFQRMELARQRDFHRGWWFWSRLVAFVPGPLVFAWASMRTFPDEALPIAIVALVFAAIAGTAVPLNLRLAAAYQHAIDSLSESR